MRTAKLFFVLAAATFLIAATPTPLSSGITPLQQMFIIKEMKPGVERVGILLSSKAADDKDLMTQIQRASAASGVKAFVGRVEQMSDVAAMFRNLLREYQVQAVWVVEEDGVLNNDISRSFLIKNTTQQGLALFAPTANWVNEGAAASLKKVDGNITLVVNRAAADAASLTVPEKYLERTQFLASN